MLTSATFMGSDTAPGSTLSQIVEGSIIIFILVPQTCTKYATNFYVLYDNVLLPIVPFTCALFGIIAVKWGFF